MDDAPRARIPALLHSQPGASTRMVAVALTLDDSTADYHLRRLRKEGRVHAQRQGRELCWFNAGSGYCPVLRRMVPAFRRGPVASVAAALEDAPRPATMLAERAGIPVGQVRWALHVLEKARVVERTTQGRTRLAEGARTCVLKAGEAARCDQWGKCAVSRRYSSP